MTARPAVLRGDIVRWRGERVRSKPHRGDATTASLSPLPDARLPSPSMIRHCLELLDGQGYGRVVTAALTPAEQVGFLAAGFSEAAPLRLLGVDLDAELPPVPPGARLVRAGRRSAAVLAIDEAAFPHFWRFDDRSLRDAVAATPRTRYRVALDSDGAAVGYAICGRAGRQGYVQRLAVAPRAQRLGTGRRLVLDGLHWLRRRGALRAVVNTQVGNSAALSLYRSLGFVDEPEGLAVLSIGLPLPSAAAP